MRKSSGPKSVCQHLNRFAIATILAGGVLLAVAGPVDAEIVYTKVHQVIQPNGSYNLDLNNDGVIDFIISNSQTPACRGEIRALDTVAETAASGNGAEGSPPARLLGQQIGPSQTFFGGTGPMAFLEYCEGMPDVGDNWIRDYRSCGMGCDHVVGQSGYLGLTFQSDGETYYGWALVSVTVNQGTLVATLMGYAYESTPGMPINAGQKK